MSKFLRLFLDLWALVGLTVITWVAIQGLLHEGLTWRVLTTWVMVLYLTWKAKGWFGKGREERC